MYVSLFFHQLDLFFFHGYRYSTTTISPNFMLWWWMVDPSGGTDAQVMVVDGGTDAQMQLPKHTFRGI